MNNLLSIIADVKRRPAAAYIERVETALGSSITETQKTAIGAFIEAEQVGGRWNAHRRLYLPIWGNAAANALCLKSLTSGTFAGTVTHGAGYVQGDGSTGYFDSGIGLSTLGLTSSSSLLSALVFAEDSRNDARSMLGVSPAEILELNGQILAIIPNVQLSVTSARTGVFSAGLTATNFRYLARRSSTGSSVISTNTTNSTTGYALNNLFGMGRNSGSPTRLHDGQFGAFCIGLGITQASEAEFSANLKTLWETCTGLTLP